MRITRKTVPGLLPKVVLWSVVLVLLVLISIFKTRLGASKAEMAAAIVLLLAALAMLIIRSIAHRRGQR